MAYTNISKSSDHFNTKLYTGNGSTNTAQTGVGFQPDWTWIKERSSTSSHILTDAVRGANKSISSNLNGAESTETQSLISFDSDGFTVGSGGGVNENSQTYAAWNWKAGNSSGSANTDGAVSSTVSVNTTAGFSIVSYAGSLSSAGSTTVGHGLGVAPQLIIAKSRTAGENWGVYHKDLTANYLLQLNTTSAQINTTSEGSFSAPTSSVFTTNYRGEWNNTGQNYIAYCFAEKQGFSKFGTYEGNNNADGTFIYTGFKPAFFIWKRISSTGGWYVSDSKRDTFNEVDVVLSANDSGTESDQGTTFDHDFVSNGIKIRNSVAAANSSGGIFIYIAFAEAPLVGSNNVPCTAR